MLGGAVCPCQSWGLRGTGGGGWPLSFILEPFLGHPPHPSGEQSPSPPPLELPLSWTGLPL